MGGGVAMLESDMTIGAISVQQSWVSKNLPGITSVTNLRFVHAYGDSMIPTFADGDILLVDSGVTEPRVDGHYVLNVHDELYIKRVSRRFDGKHEITSDNPTVRTSETLNGDHQVEVKGRVVWVWNGKRL
jgi:phage repressor protein C with HTH and peptisase S24 domain